MSERDPTFLGSVLAVSGASITVKLAESLDSGLAIINGNTYRVGQVGSFVRIPQGYQDLFGVVCEVGATVAPLISQGSTDSGRWMRVELVGEAIGGEFERGLSQHPNIGDSVHIVVEGDLRRIYGVGGNEQIPIGTLSSAENINVKISLDALVTRHSAILGSTGSGKSTTVTSLLRSIVGVENDEFRSPASRILLFDIHGEYKTALSDIAKVFSATPQLGEDPLYIPYWALEAQELLNFIAGSTNENQEIAFTDKIQELKLNRVATSPIAGINAHSVTVDSPIPFSLKKLWYELVDFETATFTGPQRDVPAQESPGDANNLVPPRYTPHAMGAAGPFLNSAAKGIKRQLNYMRSKLLDKRYDFLLHPGAWEPDLEGISDSDLDALLKGWLGHEKQITILDLSGVPSNVLERLIGSILKIIYEALFWSREKSEGGVQRPLLVVMEEAHRYLGSEKGATVEIVKRIAKEGRKYGIGAMVVSQRPAEVDETILSQCGTIIALRLSNPVDRARVKGTLPDNLAGLMDLLPVLRTGEAIITGEAARLPVRCRVTMPTEKHQPKSSDPKVSNSWATRRTAEGYDRMVTSWRSQNIIAVTEDLTFNKISIEDAEMIRMPVGSSNITAIGYEEAAQTLEVEFTNGSIYQYYNVEAATHEQLMLAPSKGQFLNTYIKNAYPFARIG